MFILYIEKYMSFSQWEEDKVLYQLCRFGNQSHMWIIFKIVTDNG